MKKRAFTMIELVMVIVVLGILAALAMPRMDRDFRQEAADNILSAIRYTQHLALLDDKTNPFDANWQQTLWQIRFTNSSADWFYTVASNMDHGANLDQNESAIDPANGKYMHSANASPADSDESPNIFLTHKYSISTVDFANCNVLTGSAGTSGTVQHIAFDHLGRPHRGVFGATHLYDTVMHGDCNITFDFTGGSFESFSIIIEKETGYAYIDGQDDS